MDLGLDIARRDLEPELNRSRVLLERAFELPEAAQRVRKAATRRHGQALAIGLRKDRLVVQESLGEVLQLQVQLGAELQRGEEVRPLEEAAREISHSRLAVVEAIA